MIFNNCCKIHKIHFTSIEIVLPLRYPHRKSSNTTTGESVGQIVQEAGGMCEGFFGPLRSFGDLRKAAWRHDQSQCKAAGDLDPVLRLGW